MNGKGLGGLPLHVENTGLPDKARDRGLPEGDGELWRVRVVGVGVTPAHQEGSVVRDATQHGLRFLPRQLVVVPPGAGSRESIITTTTGVRAQLDFLV